MFPLILECVRTKPDFAEIRRWARAVQNWDELARSATSLGVAPLLSWRLSRACPDGMPPEILAGLKKRFRECSKQNLVLTAELLRLLSLFRQAGIGAVPFKGPALAAQLYDPPGLRPSGDLDVLIDRADVRRAIDVVVATGYRPAFPNANLKVFEAGAQFPLAGVLCPLELHWLLAPRFFSALRPSRFQSRLTTATLGGCQIPAFRLEDLLPILCVHGGKHGWSSLKWLCDVARIIESPELDWDVVVAQSEAMRVTRPLLVGVELARDLLSSAVPAEIVKRIERDDAVRGCAASTRSMLESGRHAGRREQLEYRWRLLTNWRDKYLFWASYGMMPTPSDVASMPIPASLFPLYYLSRPIRLAWKWGLRRDGFS